MDKSYVIPIKLEKTEVNENNIFCSVHDLKLHKEQITAKSVCEIIDKNLQEIKDLKSNIEINFVGEYFTKLDIEKQEELLSSVLTYIKEGRVNSITITTMPKYISKENLKILRKYKVKNIKLEIITTNDYLLKKAGFNFTSDSIKKSSKLIKRFGFNLTYKIYIGLPEATKLDEINTAKSICKLRPKQVEIYPIEIKEKTKIYEEIQNKEYEELTMIQKIERAKEIFYMLNKKKINVEIKANYNDEEFKHRVESGIWFDTIVEKIKQYNVKVKEVEIEVNSINFENTIGYKNENIEKLKEYYNVDSKVVTNDDIKPGKLEIIIKKKFTDFLEE